MQSNNGSSSDVGTAWGGDAHSSVQSVSVESRRSRACRNGGNKLPTQYPVTIKFSIRISDLDIDAVRDANFNSIPLLVATKHQWDNGT